jgi:flavin reductase
VITSNNYKRGMRRLASAVSIITTQIEGKPAGMTATAVCSLTAEPPMLLICVNKVAASHALIRKAGRFTVNCLSRGDLGVAQQFSVGHMISRFQMGAWRVLSTGGITFNGRFRDECLN